MLSVPASITHVMQPPPGVSTSASSSVWRKSSILSPHEHPEFTRPLTGLLMNDSYVRRGGPGEISPVASPLPPIP